jgi:hypothetical protein
MKYEIIDPFPDIPPTEEIPDLLCDKAIEVVELVHDVFMFPYDLILLDRSHSLLGGEWGSADEGGAIQCLIAELCLSFVTGWTDGGSCYFLPGGKMDKDQHRQLALMSEADQFRFFVRVKRALVNSEPSVVTELDAEFWRQMLGTSEVPESEEIYVDDPDEKFGELFLYERHLERFGGDPRALDQFAGPKFKLDDAIAAMKVLVSRLPVNAVKRHEEACGAHRSIAA